ncbi:FAD-dependent oxidoreductase [Nitrosomonas sp. Nm166]|uniref:FAD-dependent oxidoreductase n=1 Tax=Nitrosomonas sp. Nm166 TaxID=1881054 RepID=UPI0008E55F45|nr:FAD-dependent oxidoreductase [Nitrosomonas sp. Nm166]SFE99536.1 selenide, water dikinase [Nitrosomonas sp. Nm166]
MIGLTPHKKEICLIGGGHSHITAIKKLKRRPLPGVRVTLISNEALTPYSGMLPGLIAGHYTFEDCHIDLQKLCRWANVRFIRSEVQRIDPVAKKIYCHGYSHQYYDLLSIDIGSQPALYDIKGAIAYGCSIKPINQFLQDWQQWLKTASVSNCSKRVVVIGSGAAGIEILLAMHYKLCNTTSIQADFTLIGASQNILNSYNKRVQAFFKHYLDTLGITVISGKRVISIDRHQLTLEGGTTLNYDFSVWTIHAGAQNWPEASGLECDKGFIRVDQYLRSISHPDIFAVGDCAAFTPWPLPKAGVYAVRQGSVLTNNIIAALEKRPLLAFKPQKRFLSLLTTGNRHAVAAWGPLFASGKWVWLWKNYIDRAFIAHFNPHKPIVASKNSQNNDSELL